ncbi:MAG: DUF1707 domain-containing protein [Actinomycetota bacterium]|nr:DUF1707 domain-containing protein [Actinomycetota bacterium]
MRASDADRDKVADELRIHCVEGRITLDELDHRLEGVMGAKTIRELAEFVYDLPTITVARPVDRAQPTPRIGPPGILPFTRRVLVPAPLARTRDVALDTIAPALNGYGYELLSQSPAGLVFQRRRRPGPGIVAAILFFPLGLLALLRSPKRERIVISLDQRGPASTTMTIHGVASPRVRKAFAGLTFS